MDRCAAVGVLAIVGACGGGSAIDANPGGDDATVAVVDAPATGPDAKVRPVAQCDHRSGTNLSLSLVVPEPDPRDAMLLLTSPPYDPRQFIVYREGLIKVRVDGTVLPDPFLDTTDITAGLAHEQGLLGLVFHPDYATNRTFYIYYANNTEDAVVRYQTGAADPNVADVTTATTILSIPDRFINHNGGMMLFGSDGYLYIGTGDGGGSSDPDNNAENPADLRGKMLRIDVDHPAPDGTPYSIPPDNPFALGGGAPEVYMYGLRNPWRWSFDTNGDMYIADVGQSKYEELDIITPGTGAGLNLGWDPVEGMHCHEPTNGCAIADTTLPVYEWDHGTTGLCAIIGGAVYRGDCYPDLVGTYVFTDYCKGVVFTLRAENGVVTSPPVEHPATTYTIGPYTSLYQDATGELFLGDNHGDVFHIEAGP
jgi:glucose/arabinose dehydrogenase